MNKTISYIMVLFTLHFLLSITTVDASQTTPLNPVLTHSDGVYPYANWSPWSPSGQFVAFKFRDHKVYIYDITSNLKVDNESQAIMWTFDSTKVICEKDDGIYSLNPNLDDSTAEKIIDITDVALKAISATGSGFVYQYTDNGTDYLYHTAMDGTTKALLGNINPEYITYAPDGQSIVFSGPCSDGIQDYDGIWTTKIDGTGLEQVIAPHEGGTGPVSTLKPARNFSEGRSHATHINFAPNGSYLIYSDLLGTWKVDLTTRTEEILYADTRYAQISPDGTRICYIVGSPPDHYRHTELHIADIDGSNDTKIYENVERAYWSPDGTKLAIVVLVPVRDYELYTYLYILDLSAPYLSMDVLDSDSDSLSDRYELINRYEVLYPFDDLSDNDNDGLLNKVERELGTNASVADSDFDGLIDGVEALVFCTNLFKMDTDGDGINDAEDVRTMGFEATTSTTLDGQLSITLFIPSSSAPDYVINIETYAPIAGISFNVTKSVFDFTIPDSDQAGGEFSIKVPAALVPSSNGLQAKLNNTPIEFQLIEDGDFRYVEFMITPTSQELHLNVILDPNLLVVRLQVWHWILIGASILVAGSFGIFFIHRRRSKQMASAVTRKV